MNPAVLTLMLTLLALPRAHEPAVPAAADRSATHRMKTIGVVGGLGPQATMDFEARLHRAAQRRVEPHANGGYPPMIVYYHRRPPFVLAEDGTPRFPVQIDPSLREAVARLGPLVDFLVITSNGPHLVAGEIESAAGRPVLNMVDLAVEEARSRGWRRVGVLTMGRPTLYTERLDRLGVAHEALGEELQARLNQVIFAVMEGRADEAARGIARDALATLRLRGVDGVILGCTELPLLLEPGEEDGTLIDPAQLLAEAAVDLALK